MQRDFVIKSGKLIKRKGDRNAYRTRYFVLRRTGIYYYKIFRFAEPQLHHPPPSAAAASSSSGGPNSASASSSSSPGSGAGSPFHGASASAELAIDVDAETPRGCILLEGLQVGPIVLYNENDNNNSAPSDGLSGSGGGPGGGGGGSGSSSSSGGGGGGGAAALSLLSPRVTFRRKATLVGDLLSSANHNDPYTPRFRGQTMIGSPAPSSSSSSNPGSQPCRSPPSSLLSVSPSAGLTSLLGVCADDDSLPLGGPPGTAAENADQSMPNQMTQYWSFTLNAQIAGSQNRKKYVLLANSREDAEEWVKSIRDAIDLNHTSIVNKRASILAVYSDVGLINVSIAEAINLDLPKLTDHESYCVFLMSNNQQYLILAKTPQSPQAPRMTVHQSQTVKPKPRTCDSISELRFESDNVQIYLSDFPVELTVLFCRVSHSDLGDVFSHPPHILGRLSVPIFPEIFKDAPSHKIDRIYSLFSSTNRICGGLRIRLAAKFRKIEKTGVTSAIFGVPLEKAIPRAIECSFVHLNESTLLTENFFTKFEGDILDAVVQYRISIESGSKHPTTVNSIFFWANLLKTYVLELLPSIFDDDATDEPGSPSPSSSDPLASLREWMSTSETAHQLFVRSILLLLRKIVFSYESRENRERVKHHVAFFWAPLLIHILDCFNKNVCIWNTSNQAHEQSGSFEGDMHINLFLKSWSAMRQICDLLDDQRNQDILGQDDPFEIMKARIGPCSPRPVSTVIGLQSNTATLTTTLTSEEDVTSDDISMSSEMDQSTFADELSEVGERTPRTRIQRIQSQIMVPMKPPNRSRTQSKSVFKKLLRNQNSPPGGSSLSSSPTLSTGLPTGSVRRIATTSNLTRSAPQPVFSKDDILHQRQSLRSVRAHSKPHSYENAPLRRIATISTPIPPVDASDSSPGDYMRRFTPTSPVGNTAGVEDNRSEAFIQILGSSSSGGSSKGQSASPPSTSLSPETSRPSSAAQQISRNTTADSTTSNSVSTSPPPLQRKPSKQTAAPTLEHGGGGLRGLWARKNKRNQNQTSSSSSSTDRNRSRDSIIGLDLAMSLGLDSYHTRSRDSIAFMNRRVQKTSGTDPNVSAALAGSGRVETSFFDMLQAQNFVLNEPLTPVPDEEWVLYFNPLMNVELRETFQESFVIRKTRKPAPKRKPPPPPPQALSDSSSESVPPTPVELAPHIYVESPGTVEQSAQFERVATIAVTQEDVSLTTGQQDSEIPDNIDETTRVEPEIPFIQDLPAVTPKRNSWGSSRDTSRIKSAIESFATVVVPSSLVSSKITDGSSSPMSPATPVSAAQINQRSLFQQKLQFWRMMEGSPL